PRRPAYSGGAEAGGDVGGGDVGGGDVGGGEVGGGDVGGGVVACGTVNSRTTQPSRAFVWPLGGAGSCFATMPGVLQALFGAVPPRTTVKPADWSSFCASEYVRQTTFGTNTCFLPDETTRWIVVPSGTSPVGS